MLSKEALLFVNKKKQKNFMTLGHGVGQGFSHTPALKHKKFFVAPTARGLWHRPSHVSALALQKFFASFFQKRSASLP
jgi:hypothetical protein